MFAVSLDGGSVLPLCRSRVQSVLQDTTSRLVKMAARFAERPDGGTGAQTENWDDLKAAYRFLDNDAISLEALIEPHCHATREAARGVVLIANDTTECDFR